MSKLYNTLQQIRRNETYGVQNKNGVSPGGPAKGKGRQKAGVGLLLAACVALIIYLALPFFNKPTGHSDSASVNQSVPVVQHPEFQSQIAKTSIPAQTSSVDAGTAAQSAPSAKDLASLNNTGVKYVQKQDHWKGLYYLKKALEIKPQRIEPLINTAVALTELGLYGPAAHYFNEAYKLDPDHSGLRENIAVIAQANIMEGPFMELKGR